MVHLSPRNPLILSLLNLFNRPVHSAAPAQPVSDPDTALLERIAEGDAQAFELLVSRHVDRILAFVQRMLGSREDAEDVTQEVFLKAWQWAARWRSGEARFSTWLHTVALNACRQRWRRASPETSELNEELVSPLPQPDVALDADLQAQRVRLALSELPERQRAAMVLSHYQGMSNIESADILGVSVEAVESLLGRARRSLRKRLVAEFETLSNSER